MSKFTKHPYISTDKLLRHFILLLLLLVAASRHNLSAQTYVGNVILLTQNDVNNFGIQPYTAIQGNLIIDGLLSPNQITSLQPLNKLQTVSGNLRILDHQALTNLIGLDNVTTVGGELDIIGNSNLIGLFGLQKITSVGGRVRIWQNNALPTLAGLDNLQTVGGSLVIEQNANMQFFSGLLKLQTVTGSFAIFNNVQLKNLTGLQVIQTIGGSLLIDQNTILTDISRLSTITSVGGNLNVSNNPQLASCCVLEPLIAATAGTKTIASNAAGCNSAADIATACALPTFTEVAANLPGVQFAAARWGDYDNDGDLDLLLLGTGLNQSVSKIYRNTNGSFTDSGVVLPILLNVAAEWGDYDNDGDLDILMAGTGLDNLPHSLVYRNDNGIFTDILAGLAGIGGGAVVWGDYDQDGDLDILLSGNNSDDIISGTDYITKIYRNESGLFTDINAALPGASGGALAWGDYDNDGDLDILLTGTITGSIRISRIYRNDSNVFTDINAGLADVNNSSVAWGDYDNDGDLDILLTGSIGGVLTSKVYRNDNGIFADTNAGLPGISAGSVAWGDYDNDGDLDILLSGLATGNTTLSKVYANTNGIFTDSNAGLEGTYFNAASFGDYDNDGDLDILIAGLKEYFTTNFITKLYRNNVTIANTPPAAPTNLNAAVNGQEVTLSWNAATDSKTPAAGLNYNLYVGTSPQGVQKVSPQSGIANGYRRVVALGNGQTGTTFTLKDLPPGTFYWSVQAVDASFAGSPFATEGSFSINTAPVANNDNYVTDENIPLNVAAPGVLENDTDTDGNSLTALLITGPALGTLTLNADGSFTYTPNAGTSGADSFTYKASDGLAESQIATVNITINAVNNAPEVSSNPSTQEVQYSDPVLPVTISATDADNSLTELSIAASWKLSTDLDFTAGLPASLSLSGPSDQGNTRSWTLSGKAMVAPGIYTIRVGVNDGTNNADNNTGFTDIELIVKPENAVATYTGALFVSTATPKSSTATVLLSATIQDISALPANALYDAYPGDIKNATVTFKILETGEEIPAAVGYVNPADAKTGTATASWTANLAGDDSQSYTIRVKVGGYYKDYEQAVVTVSKPIDGLVSGGGFLLITQSAGEKAADTGSKNNFGFSIKNGKKGAQGRINTLVRHTGADGLLYTYQIKGNVMQSLHINGNKASFEGKASIQDVTDPDNVLSVDGNAALQVQMTDNGEPGSSDQIAITLYNKNGGLWFASYWNGVKTAEQTIAAGNLKISGGVSAAKGGKNARESFEEQAGESLSIRAYPNPVSGKLTVELGTYPAASVKATQVVDATGKAIQTNAHKVLGENLLEIDMHPVKPGLYILKLQGEGFWKTVKVVRQ